MANIKPFCGYRYNPDKIRQPGEVMAPPYDSLSDAQTDSFYDSNPYNAARLISQRTYETDTEDDNCYTRSGRFLESWIEEEVLIPDKKKSFYVYEQTITVNREKYYNRGIIGLLELTDYSEGTVVPCENPSTDSTLDRFNMISETRSNNSLVSCMYTDGDKSLSNLMNDIAETPAVMEFTTDYDGISHKLWVVDGDADVEMIEKIFSSRRIFIVDGHNRYEACLDYKNQCKKMPGYTGNESFNYVMALISDSNEDGRIQMPVHRLLSKEKNFNETFVLAGLQDHFHIEKIIVDKMDDEEFYETLRKQIATQRKETIFAIYTGEDYFYRLTFKNKKYLDNILPDASDVYKSLDLCVINSLVFEEQLNMDPESDMRIEYSRSLSESVKAVDRGDYNCLFAVNPVRNWQFDEMSSASERLPKRSVSIFPKPATGIVIHKFTSEI